ncbi:MAG: hypothetical protein WC758_08020 [Candidatus Woesearchaeota archaeon]|jgi:hypothetical protein
MGQGDILELLEKESSIENPLSIREIANKINEKNVNKIFRDIKKLLHYKEIDYLEIDKETANIKYKSKRRLRVYFVH